MIPLLLFAAVSAAIAQPPREFGNWMVGCDNGFACRAVGFQVEGEEEFYSLSVFRSGDPGAAPKVTLDVEGVIAAVGDGKRVPLRFGGEDEIVAADVPALLALVLASKKLEFVNKAGKVVARISPQGSSAALRWMDERQNRAGSVTALVARGPRAASALPAPPRLSRVEVAARSTKPAKRLAAAAIADIQKTYDCSPSESAEPEFQRLDATHSLALVPCNMGAYQGSSIALLVDDSGNWTAPRFVGAYHNPEDAPPGLFKPEELTEPEFDAKTLELWTAYKGRGLNDCGGMEGYAWDGQRFRLVYQNVMDSCSGSRERITIWRTANHPED
jgi:hypothetical protein